jgi:hypothetical protein
MANFDDQDEVLEEVAHELDIDPDELDIITNTALESFGAGDVYEIRFKHKPHGKTWSVVENDEVFHELAIEVVKQDLEQEPEIFNRSFIEQHINMDRLQHDLHSDVYSTNYDRLEEMNPEDFWREAEGFGMDAPEQEEDDEGNLEDLREPTSGEVDRLAEKITDEELRDPMRYLEDIYGEKEAVEQAIKIAGIDIDAAAEDAVDTDGAEHFLARYDGDYHTTPSGFVYWRDN